MVYQPIRLWFSVCVMVSYSTVQETGDGEANENDSDDMVTTSK